MTSCVPADEATYVRRRSVMGNPITATFVGLELQVFLPKGGVVIEAGRLIEDQLTGTFTFEAGNRLTPADIEALCGVLSG